MEAAAVEAAEAADAADDAAVAAACAAALAQGVLDLPVVGSGMSGTVFVVDVPSFGPVALKVHEGGEQELWNAAEVEAHLMRLCRHPFVARCYSHQHNSVAMELCGDSLEELVAVRPGSTHMQVAEREGLGTCARLLLGLARMHAAGVMHRDICPANVFHTDDARFVIADFGSATNAVEARTRHGRLQFTAPEMLAGSLYDRSVDMWSVGCTLFFDITNGRLPFRSAQTAEELMESQRTPPLIPMIIKAHTQDLIMRMLAFHASERITAADAICHPALAPFVDRCYRSDPRVLEGTGVRIEDVRAGIALSLSALRPLPGLAVHKAEEPARKQSAIVWASRAPPVAPARAQAPPLPRRTVFVSMFGSQPFPLRINPAMTLMDVSEKLLGRCVLNVVNLVAKTVSEQRIPCEVQPMFRIGASPGDSERVASGLRVADANLGGPHRILLVSFDRPTPVDPSAIVRVAQTSMPVCLIGDLRELDALHLRALLGFRGCPVARVEAMKTEKELIDALCSTEFPSTHVLRILYKDQVRAVCLRPEETHADDFLSVVSEAFPALHGTCFFTCASSGEELTCMSQIRAVSCVRVEPWGSAFAAAASSSAAQAAAPFVFSAASSSAAQTATPFVFSAAFSAAQTATPFVFSAASSSAQTATPFVFSAAAAAAPSPAQTAAPFVFAACAEDPQDPLQDPPQQK